MGNPFAAVELALSAIPLAVFDNATMRWNGTLLNGVYDSAYIDTLGTSNSAPNFLCDADAIKSMTAGDVVVICRKGVESTYTTREIQRDSSGATRLVLESA